MMDIGELSSREQRPFSLASGSGSKRMVSVGNCPWVRCGQCFNTVGRVSGRASGPEEPVPLMMFTEVLF